MDYRGLLGWLAWSAVGLGGPACGLEPGGSGETETIGDPSATSSDSGNDGTTLAPDLGEECEASHTETFVVLVGMSEGVTMWSSVIEGERTIGGVSAVPDSEGGVVFASLIVSQGTHLVRHDANGTRVAALPLTALPHALATDGNGRIVYTGIFQAEDGLSEAMVGELDLSLTPLGAPRALPWSLDSRHGYRVGIAAAADGTTVAAGGDSRGTGRFISKLDAEGNEVWTSPWPIGTNPDVFGSGRVAGVAVLDDGTVGLVLTSGDRYDGNLWLEVFDPDGLHVSAVTAPGRKTMGVTGRVDTFVVSSDEQIDAYTADGAEAWSNTAEIRGLARPCTDTQLVAATPTGYIRFSPGGGPGTYDVDLFEIVLPMLEESNGEAESLVHDVVCTPDGDVIVVADVNVYTSGDCHTSG